MNRRLAVAALAAALTPCLAACSPGGPAQPSASPSLNDVQKNLAVTKRFVKCAREHGYPTFPDAVVDNGEVTYAHSSDAEGAAIKSKIAALERVPECKAILTEMQALRPRNVGPRNRPTGKPSAEIMQKLRRFAQCMRQHGVPAWPDPKSDGSFPVSQTTVGDPKANPTARAAGEACEQHRAGTEPFGYFS
ncbi:hypothetical protein [Actinomadura alba]|uniref:Lipoprotein n=1 Tax=Actinomadura alba TaxID=406431 RepID=A0ABR7LXV8_9ACTN|nr:hypothetical protein [Actinomadura alba]MBC6469697.1 hypothetical protein [Actinomadura alba]